jgi:hypothetical protein
MSKPAGDSNDKVKHAVDQLFVKYDTDKNGTL